jgi:peroxiredoxin
LQKAGEEGFAAKQELKMLEGKLAPELIATRWFNTDHALTLADLRGKVVALHAFQMLCPGCTQHGLPQAQKLHVLFGGEQFAMIGIHTVFEHHAAMTPPALEAFIYEYHYTFPIAVDAPGDNGNAIPQTMERYRMQGTPTLVLIDRDGRIRHHWFGRLEDLVVGAAIGRLLEEVNTPNVLTA